MSEAEVLNNMIAGLMRLQPGVMYWRNNTGAVKVDDRFIRFSLPGAPDILGCANGRAFGVECKSSTGRQSATQQQWQKRWEAAGGKYFLVSNDADIAIVVRKIEAL